MPSFCLPKRYEVESALSPAGKAKRLTRPDTTSAMTIYCLYIFDRYVRAVDSPTKKTESPARHCNCVYYHDWHRTKRPKRANDGGDLLPGVSHALSPLPLPSTTAAAGTAGPGSGSGSGSAPGSASGTPFSSPRNTLASNSGVLIAFSDGSQSPSFPASTATAAAAATPPPLLVQTQGGTGGGAASSAGLPFDEESKLVYGVILSLRNMVKRLSGRYVSPPYFPQFVLGLSSRSLSLMHPTRRVRLVLTAQG